jgi:hypothetical protein
VHQHSDECRTSVKTVVNLLIVSPQKSGTGRTTKRVTAFQVELCSMEILSYI